MRIPAWWWQAARAEVTEHESRLFLLQLGPDPNFVLKGLYFSLMLTLVATIGGVLFGTVLALMRLSGRKWLDVPATIYVNGMRSIPLVMVILWFFLLMPCHHRSPHWC